MTTFEEMVEEVVAGGLTESAVVSNYFLTEYPYGQNSFGGDSARFTLLRHFRQRLNEVSPPGFKGTVKAMKKRHSDEIDNPWALSWWMKKRGYKSHKKATGGPK
jgi:hypothetical protein